MYFIIIVYNHKHDTTNAGPLCAGGWLACCMSAFEKFVLSHEIYFNLLLSFELLFNVRLCYFCGYSLPHLSLICVCVCGRLNNNILITYFNVI